MKEEVIIRKAFILKPEQTASEAWLSNIKNPLVATVKEIQSINEFNSLYPMQVIANSCRS
ncbi:MAG: glycoside hydrolase domain-containing protein [Ferruginibacter sp.]